MGCAEAIQTAVVYFQHYHSLSLSVAYRYFRKEWNADIKKELGICEAAAKNHRYNLFFLFFISCLRLGLLFEACSPHSDLGSAQKSLGTADLAILA